MPHRALPSAYRPLICRTARRGRSRRVQSATMTTRSQREAESRAEARRRARRLAQGRVEEDVATEDEPAAGAAPAPRGTGNLLERLFPPAAPLPGKVDPLAGFGYDGPLRGVVSTLYLLGRSPLIWIAMGVVWALAYIGTLYFGQSLIGIVASMVSFVALIAAGWLGWQRPWAFGFAAAVLGYLLYAVFVILNLSSIPAQGAFTVGELANFLAVSGLLQVAVGVVAGFYGGYLRRRLNDSPGGKQQQRRRR